MRRYTIETGKFGQFFRDNEAERDLTLQEVEDILNEYENYEEAYQNMKDFAENRGLDTKTYG